MALLTVERIKLFSTRSPWWCMLSAVVLSVGFTALFVAETGAVLQLTVSTTQLAHNFGLMVIMVMAALAITTEYRFGTIKATFQAVPDRTAVLVSKTVVVAAVSGVVGEVVAFASWGIARLIKPDADLAITTADQWRNVAGVGLVYAVGAVLAIGVGLLVRQTAAAVAAILVWSLLVESLIGLIPTIGVKIQAWLPFNTATHFLNGDQGVVASGQAQVQGIDYPFGPWVSLLYFAGVAVAVLVAGIVSANVRDA
jgi:ABC-2 type transport system permease protein